jgi:PAS domain S-box-containing protein
MMEPDKHLNVAIVGGGPGCKAIMDMIFAKKLSQLQMKLIGVSDTSADAVGCLLAQDKGIFTTQDYRQLYELEDLHMIIELTGREDVANEVYQTKPGHIRVMDHVAARLFWDVFQIEEQSLAERERAETALRESEEKYSTSVENSLTGIYIDQDGKIVFANKKFAEIYRYARDELIGMDARELVHPKDRGLTDEMREKRLGGEDVPSEYEARGLKKSGETVWIARRNAAIEYKGKPAILGNIVDITDRKRAEGALRESEERYHTVLEASPDPVVVYDQDGESIYINPAFTRVFGWTPEERLGKKLDYVPEENWPETEMMIEKIRTGESFSGIESRRYNKEGDILDVSISAATYVNHRGKPAGSVHILRDISDQKLVEDALRESEERYRTVLEASPDPIVVYDMKGKCIYVNPAFTGLFGWTPEELLGKKLDYVPEESWPETKMMIEKVKAGESFSGVETRRYDKDRKALDVSISASIYLNREGTPAGSVHVIRDITEQKRVEKALKKARQELEVRVEERTAELRKANELLQQEMAERERAQEEILKSKTMLQSVFDGISDPLIMLDTDLTVKMLNTPAANYYQVKPEDVIGKSCHQAFRGRQEPCEECHIPAAVLRARSVTLERKGLMNPDRLEQVVIYPIKEKGMEVSSAIIFISDITETRFMERQLIRSEKLASLGLLVSGVAHEINNPLAIINEKAGLMKDILGFAAERFEHKEKFLGLLESIFTSVDRSRVITRRLLGFAKAVDVKVETIDMNQLLEEVLGFLDKEAFHRKLNVNLDFSPDLGTLESDRGQLQQVFLNIIKNAFEVMDDGGHLSIVTRLADSDNLQVTITDDGRGMSPEQVENIFEPFYTSGKASGTGLGLFITHGIVTKNLGGEIVVQSEEGKGTTFAIGLPKKKGVTDSRPPMPSRSDHGY